MVLMATQQAIVEAGQVARGEDNRHKSTKKGKSIARGTFFRYKNKTLDIDHLTDALFRPRRQTEA